MKFEKCAACHVHSQGLCYMWIQVERSLSINARLHLTTFSFKKLLIDILHTSWPQEFLSQRNVLFRPRSGWPGQYFQSPEARSCRLRRPGAVLVRAQPWLCLPLRSKLCRRSIFFVLVQSNLTCAWFEVEATCLGRALDTGKVTKKGNFWLPRKIRKECATE